MCSTRIEFGWINNDGDGANDLEPQTVKYVSRESSCLVEDKTYLNFFRNPHPQERNTFAFHKNHDTTTTSISLLLCGTQGPNLRETNCQKFQKGQTNRTERYERDGLPNQQTLVDFTLVDFVPATTISTSTITIKLDAPHCRASTTCDHGTHTWDNSILLYNTATSEQRYTPCLR